MNKILIVNKKDRMHRVNGTNGILTFYIGRPSPLGNPYMIESWMGGGCGRIAAIREYRSRLREQLNIMDKAVINELMKMAIALKEGDIALECWCSPMLCHGEVIKEYLETGKI